MCPERYDELNAGNMSHAQSQSHTSTKGCNITLTFESDTYKDTIKLHDLVEEGKCYMGKFLMQARNREYRRFVEGTYNQLVPESQAVQGQGAEDGSFEILGVLTYLFQAKSLCIIPISSHSYCQENCWPEQVFSVRL